MLKHLSRTHEVTLASPVRSTEEVRGQADLQACGIRTLGVHVSELTSRLRALACLATQQPASMGYFYSPRLAAAVRAALAGERYDLICVHCSAVAPYVELVRDIPKMLDFADMDSQKWRAYAAHRRFPLSLAYALEGWKLQRRERELLQRFDLCSCTTRDELDTLRNYGTGARSACFPNGVDTEYFAPTDAPFDPDTICFIGRMDYYPNLECMVRFCAETLPRLRQRRPAIKLLIVGANPSYTARRLGEYPGVTVTGSVADVRPHLRRAALSVAPLRIARGTQNKVLESLAMGVPVVCSSIAARGVDVIPGEHVLVADDPQQCVEMILRLLENAAERDRFAAAGRARMLSHHRWERSLRQFDALIEECVATHAASFVG